MSSLPPQLELGRNQTESTHPRATQEVKCQDHRQNVQAGASILTVAASESGGCRSVGRGALGTPELLQRACRRLATPSAGCFLTPVSHKTITHHGYYFS